MNFGDIVGQSALTANLTGQMRSGRIVHAYLFVGEAGAGKRTLAAICARALVCSGPEDARPCDECGPCVRALSGNHPDILTLEPGYAAGARGDKRPRSISVDDVRALGEFLSRKPFEARRNVALIPRAQLMTPQAQNALLKTLETPPGDSVIILTCDNLRALLPTIVSRCRTVHFQPLDAGVVEQYMLERGVAPGRARLLAALSGGSLGRALEMDQNEDYWRTRATVLDAIAALEDETRVALVTSGLRELRDSAEWVLDALELYARDLMLDGMAEPLNADRRAQIAVQARRLNGLNMLSGVMRAREQMRSNVGWMSVLDMICFKALEV